jgi:hypothetical protein
MALGEIVFPGWFVDALLVIVLCFLILALYWTAEKILHVQLHALVSLVKSEWDDSKARKRTVGMYNWRGFIALILVGFVCMIFISSQKLIGIIAIAIGLDKAAELVKSTNFLVFVYFLAGYLLLSLLCVIVDNRGRPPRP